MTVSLRVLTPETMPQPLTQPFTPQMTALKGVTTLSVERLARYTGVTQPRIDLVLIETARLYPDKVFHLEHKDLSGRTHRYVTEYGYIACMPRPTVLRDHLAILHAFKHAQPTNDAIVATYQQGLLALKQRNEYLLGLLMVSQTPKRTQNQIVLRRARRKWEEQNKHLYDLPKETEAALNLYKETTQ